MKFPLSSSRLRLDLNASTDKPRTFEYSEEVNLKSFSILKSNIPPGIGGQVEAVIVDV
tara:strand:- start:628 stop:801 length:174 start_codon:yes stop_codon:yes gene_type:complete